MQSLRNLEVGTLGTRSLTHVKDDNGRTLVTIYRQMDGYPTGHGADLLAFLKDRKVVNGISSNTPAKASNGMGCLAASLVETLKAEAGIGGIYLYPPDSSDCGEEWTYTVSWRGSSLHGLGHIEGQLWLTVEGYDGPADDFDPVAVEARPNE
jgi:hypothetical protein